MNVHTACCDGDRDGVNDVGFTVNSFDDGCVDNEGVEYGNDAVDDVGDGGKEPNGGEVDDSAFDNVDDGGSVCPGDGELDDKPFDDDDDDMLLSAMAFGSQCICIVAVDDVIDDICADP